MGLFSGFSGSKSKSKSQSSSASQQSASASQDIFGPQKQALGQFAFPAAQGLATRLAGQAEQLAPQLSGQLGQTGQSFLGQLDVAQNPFLQGLAQFGQGGGLSGQTDQLVDQLGQDIQQQLGRDQFGAGQQQSLSGNRGGGRQGVAEGLLGEAALNTFGRESANLRFGAAQQDQQAQLQALLGGANASTAAAQGGLSQLGGLFDLGLGGLSGQFSPIESLANLLPATVLSESQSQGTSSSQASGRSSGKSFAVGFN